MWRTWHNCGDSMSVSELLIVLMTRSEEVNVSSRSGSNHFKKGVSNHMSSFKCIDRPKKGVPTPGPPPPFLDPPLQRFFFLVTGHLPSGSKTLNDLRRLFVCVGCMKIKLRPFWMWSLNHVPYTLTYLWNVSISGQHVAFYNAKWLRLSYIPTTSSCSINFPRFIPLDILGKTYLLFSFLMCFRPKNV